MLPLPIVLTHLFKLASSTSYGIDLQLLGYQLLEFIQSGHQSSSIVKPITTFKLEKVVLTSNFKSNLVHSKRTRQGSQPSESSEPSTFPRSWPYEWATDKAAFRKERISCNKVVQKNNQTLEHDEYGTWTDMTNFYKNLAVYGPKVAADFFCAVAFPSISALTDALINRRRWTDTMIVLERNLILGKNSGANFPSRRFITFTSFW